MDAHAVDEENRILAGDAGVSKAMIYGIIHLFDSGHRLPDIVQLVEAMFDCKIDPMLALDILDRKGRMWSGDYGERLL